MRVCRREAVLFTAGLTLAALQPWSAAVFATPNGDWTTDTCPPRTAAGSVYDPLRDRLIVFGGFDGSNRNDTWALDLAPLPRWTRLLPEGDTPPGRSGHVAVYDPVRDRIVISGGTTGGTHLDDVWVLELEPVLRWQKISPAGKPPSGRSDHAAAYVPGLDAVVVFGGWDSPVHFLDETWALVLSGTPTWELLETQGTPPSPRKDALLVHDGDDNRVFVFGGIDTAYRNDVWELALKPQPTWTQVSPTGTPPSGRRDAAGVYDAVHRRVVLFGGLDGAYRSDAWELVLGSPPKWRAVPASAMQPAGRSYHTAAFDTARHRFLVFGGYNGAYYDDTWALGLAGAPAWAPVHPLTTTITSRLEHTAILDPKRDRMLVFGGYDGAWKNDVWSLPLSGGSGWSLFTPGGTPPGPRIRHSAIYDPMRDRMLVFGGQNFIQVTMNDTWALDLGSDTWSAVPTTGGPPGVRLNHVAVYDPVRDRMLVHGGTNGATLRDTWALDLQTHAWSLVDADGLGRSEHTCIYDPAGDRLLVVAGWEDGWGPVNDTYAFDLSSGGWQVMGFDGILPAPRTNHSAVYDAARERILVFGGYDGYGPYRNDAWELSLTGKPAWQSLVPGAAPPGPRAYHTAIWDPAHDNMRLFGGGGTRFGDTWTFDMLPAALPGAKKPLATLQTQFHAAFPNPFGPRTTLAFELVTGADVRAEIFDVAGRRVRTLVATRLAPGAHAVRWDGADEHGVRASAGSYVCRLVTGDTKHVQRLVLLK